MNGCESARREQDFLFVDLPPGAERTFQYAEFLGPEAAFVLVTLPTDLARGVVARSVAALSKTPNRLLGYIENMQGYYCADCRQVRPLFPDTGSVELGLPCLGSVPFDPGLAGSGRRSDGPARQALGEVAGRLLQALEAKR